MSSNQPQQLLKLSVEIFDAVGFFFSSEPFIFSWDVPFEYKCDRFLGAMDRLHKTTDLALNCQDPLALDVHSMLLLLERDLSIHEHDVLDNPDFEANYVADEAEIGRTVPTEELEKMRVYLCKQVVECVDQIREKHYDRIEVLAAKLFTKSLASGAKTRNVPLTNRAQAVYELIAEYGPITGREIIDKLDETVHGYSSLIDQSALTKEIVPELKRLRNVLNRPGAGYYDSTLYDPEAIQN